MECSKKSLWWRLYIQMQVLWFCFRQSVNRHLKETVFSRDKSAVIFRSLSKKMLEAKAEAQFGDAYTEIGAFVDEGKENH